MVHHKSQTTAKLDTLLNQAVLGVQSRLYKSSYKATKQLGLYKDTVTRRVNRGLSHSQAHQKQQRLLYTEKVVLFK
jgi:hypothetical protein